MDFTCLWRNSRTCQNKLSFLIPVVHFKPDGIPQVRRYLPFVNQPRGRTIQHTLRIDRSNLLPIDKVRGIIHVNNAFCLLLRRSGLPTPFGTLYQNSSHSRQFLLQQPVGNPRFIRFHTLIFSGCKNRKILFHFQSWPIFISKVGRFSFPKLADNLTPSFPLPPSLLRAARRCT